ncbi:hypothetical protein [Mesorhizobium sp. B4-1-4]|uniref:hypothetical protein n=1 Tax=Mesorhizobium sp. B4-1-4 TaxID=2589888 RepID=UPI00112801E1|nr:hypothetical protein [Mesorhizobium sp. B4-1-4]UCI31981.1 hypothetical protein FJW03_00460 [Mesorhizobium sp. B4-1-4]
MNEDDPYFRGGVQAGQGDQLRHEVGPDAKRNRVGSLSFNSIRYRAETYALEVFRGRYENLARRPIAEMRWEARVLMPLPLIDRAR